MKKLPKTFYKGEWNMFGYVYGKYMYFWQFFFQIKILFTYH